jgi:LysR family transcriptional regulator, hydrogen peroxide-inducible genes activator
MEIHQLRYFCAIVKYGTFTRAAESVYVAQPSLSQQILKLEDELGGKLFYRLPRAARLTPLGEFFLPRALAILQEISDSKTGARKIIELRRSQTMPEPATIDPSRRMENEKLSATENLISKLPKSA